MSSNLFIAEPALEVAGQRPSLGNGPALGNECSVSVLEADEPRQSVYTSGPVATAALPIDYSIDAAEDAKLISDLIQLTKPRIVVMILVTTVATSMIAAGGWVSLGPLTLLLFATALVAGSAGGANQIWERVIDCRMARTATRPLPSSRLSTGFATAFTASIGTLGTALLWMGFGFEPAAVGLATWILYVFAYTPMKTRTSWNTTMGAIAGALPMLIGYTAFGGTLQDPTGWLLFGVLAAWQYPHFMAIAWLYRRQYAEAGFCMTTTVEPTGISAGLQSVFGSVAVAVCSVALCFPSPSAIPSILATLAVVAATFPMFRASVRFLTQRDDVTARRLLRSSLLVLPAVLAVVTTRLFW